VLAEEPIGPVPPSIVEEPGRAVQVGRCFAGSEVLRIKAQVPHVDELAIGRKDIGQGAGHLEHPRFLRLFACPRLAAQELLIGQFLAGLEVEPSEPDATIRYDERPAAQ